MERLDLANSTEILEKLIILNNLEIWLSEPFSNKSINPKSPHQDFIFHIWKPGKLPKKMKICANLQAATALLMCYCVGKSDKKKEIKEKEHEGRQGRFTKGK